MYRLQSIFITISFICILSCSSKINQPIEPKEDPIITYDISIPPEGYKVYKSYPSLRIYKNGVILIGDPFGYRNTKKKKSDHISLIQGQITTIEIQSLQNFILKQKRFSTINNIIIQKKIKEKNIVQVMDAKTYFFDVVISKNKSHQLQIYDLPGIENIKGIKELQNLKDIRNRLEKLRLQVIKKYKNN